MNTINQNQYSLKEFKYHLDTMSKTLKNNKSLPPDYFDGFIEFFNNEINNFNTSLTDEKKITLLDLNLSNLNETIKQVASAKIKSTQTHRENVVVPRLGKKISPSTLPGSDGNVKAGLERINNEYDIYPIKGDGHCLYRSILGQILLQIPKLAEEDYNHFLNNQIIFINDNPTLEKHYTQLKNYLDDIRALNAEEQEQRFQEIMADAKNSDKLVKYLRLLCEKHHRENYNEVNENEFISSTATNKSEGSVDQYLEELVSMKNKIALGGQPEIAALTAILGVKMHILNCDTIGQGNDYNLGYHFHGNPNSPITFPLLFRPGHYDMAVAK